MKLKIDFVTNSSSSSFVVMGSIIEPTKIPNEIIEKLAVENHVEPEEVLENLIEYSDKLVEKTDLELSGGYDYDECMVGIKYTKMKSGETFGQFQDRVQEEIKKAFGIDTKPAYIEECWENR